MILYLISLKTRHSSLFARKTIRTAAIAGIVWGIINLLIGYQAVQVNILNSAFWVSQLQRSRRELWHWLDRRYTCC